MVGWVKIHRKLLEKGFYKRSEYVHLWLHILLKANHKPAEFLWNKQTMVINTGQFLTGRKQLSSETGITQSNIENILRFLENEHQIEQQKTTKFRIITVKKWEKYQIIESSEQQNEQQSDNRVTTEEQQSDTNKNNKKNKNDKNDKKKTGTEINFPDNLNNEGFKSSWSEWVEYKRESKKKLSSVTITKQLQFLSKQSNPVAVINQSIQNGWQGLFELKNKINGSSNQQRKGQNTDADYSGRVISI